MKTFVYQKHYKKSRRQVTDMNLPYDLEFHFYACPHRHSGTCARGDIKKSVCSSIVCNSKKLKIASVFQYENGYMCNTM